jgi:hypothetical protein
LLLELFIRLRRKNFAHLRCRNLMCHPPFPRHGLSCLNPPFSARLVITISNFRAIRVNQRRHPAKGIFYPLDIYSFYDKRRVSGTGIQPWRRHHDASRK